MFFVRKSVNCIYRKKKKTISNSRSYEQFDKFIGMSKFAAWRILLQWLLTCLNVNLVQIFFLLIQMRKMIYMAYGSNTSSWKPWSSMRLDLIFTMTRDIDIYSNLHLPKKIAAVAKASSYKNLNDLNDFIRIWKWKQNVWWKPCYT